MVLPDDLKFTDATPEIPLRSLTPEIPLGGAEAAGQIVALDPEAKLVVSSGYCEDPVMASYWNYGFCAAIGKPYKAEELASRLGRLFDLGKDGQ